jgi:hypothetical protein
MKGTVDTSKKPCYGCGTDQTQLRNAGTKKKKYPVWYYNYDQRGNILTRLCMACNDSIIRRDERRAYGKRIRSDPARMVILRERNVRWKRDPKNSKRLKIIYSLGAKCCEPKCLVPGGCDDIRCLVLDHIKGGGCQDRKRFGLGTKKVGEAHSMYSYYALYLNEARQVLQVLCANCNMIKVIEKSESRRLLS